MSDPYKGGRAHVTNSPEHIDNIDAKRVSLVTPAGVPDYGSDFYLKVAQGLVEGYSIVNKFGQNSAIGTGDYEDIWDGGGTYTYPTDGTAPITHIYSTDGGDTEPINVQGLDITGALVLQTITLTGTTVAPLTTPLWRCFRLKNVGTNNLIGVIHASDSGKAVSYAQIVDGNNQTLMALYTIPLGKKGYIIQSQVSMAGLTSAYTLSARMWMRPHGLVFQMKGTNGVTSTGSSALLLPVPLPGAIPALTDLRIDAISSKAGGIMNARWAILLVDD